MDMITGLPSSADADSKAYDAILVIVDRFIKIAKYFLVRKTIGAVEMA